MYKKAVLVNEYGDEFIGWTTEEFKPTTGELIFNTAMTGFVEILSDPSYTNQLITFTSSHVGNYGMSQTDFESNEPKIEGAIANSFTYNPSSWRSEKSITDWLNEYEIPFSGGFDVRAITTHLRDSGSGMFAFGTDANTEDLKQLLINARNIIGDNSALWCRRNDFDWSSNWFYDSSEYRKSLFFNIYWNFFCSPVCFTSCICDRHS